MRSFVLTLFMLAAPPAFADSLMSKGVLIGSGPTDAIGKGLVIEPMVTTTFATFGVDGKIPNSMGFAAGPELRIGYQFMPFAVMAHINYAAMLAVNNSSLAALSFGVDLFAYLVQLPVWPVRLYVTASGDAGPLFYNYNPFDGTLPTGTIANGIYPTAGAQLAIGANYAICKSRSINVELGYHHQWSAYPFETSSAGAVFIGVGASFLPFEACGPQVASGIAAAGQPSDDGVCTGANCKPAEVKDKSSKCTTTVADGWMEATQGAFADDESFLDKIAELHRMPGATPVYNQDIDMVKDRATVLVGVHHYKTAGGITPVHSRKNIVLRGTSNCSQAKDVKLVVTLTDQSGAREVVATDVVGQVPLTGPALDRPLPWVVSIDAFHGLPKDKTFAFKQTGDYNLSGELQEKTGEKTGLKVQVTGKVVNAGAWRFGVVPVSLGGAAPTAAATALAVQLKDHASEYLPGAVQVKSLEEMKFDPAMGNDANLAAVVGDRLSVAAANADVHRLFAVVSAEEWKQIADAANGYAASTHIIFIRAGENAPAAADLPTAIREFLYTVPNAVWTGEGCGRAYYKTANHYANGLRIAADRAQWDGPYAGATEFSADGDKRGWITQCAYVNVLRHAPAAAAAALVVHGTITGATLKLGPIFAAEVGPDTLPADGNVHIEMKDARGKVLAKLAANASFESGDGATRTAIPFDVRVPAVEGVKEITVTFGTAPGAATATDSRKVSGEAPSVKITAVKKSGKSEHVTWAGTGESGKTLTYTISYMTDGLTWNTLAIDTTETTIELPTPPRGAKAEVRVVVSDGTRSGDVVVPLK